MKQQSRTAPPHSTLPLPTPAQIRHLRRSTKVTCQKPKRLLACTAGLKGSSGQAATPPLQGIHQVPYRQLSLPALPSVCLTTNIRPKPCWLSPRFQNSPTPPESTMHHATGSDRMPASSVVLLLLALVNALENGDSNQPLGNS